MFGASQPVKVTCTIRTRKPGGEWVEYTGPVSCKIQQASLVQRIKNWFKRIV